MLYSPPSAGRTGSKNGTENYGLPHTEVTPKLAYLGDQSRPAHQRMHFPSMANYQIPPGDMSYDNTAACASNMKASMGYGESSASTCMQSTFSSSSMGWRQHPAYAAMQDFTNVYDAPFDHAHSDASPILQREEPRMCPLHPLHPHHQCFHASIVVQISSAVGSNPLSYASVGPSFTHPSYETIYSSMPQGAPSSYSYGGFVQQHQCPLQQQCLYQFQQQWHDHRNEPSPFASTPQLYPFSEVVPTSEQL